MCWVTLSPKGRVSWWLGSTFWESRGVRGLAGSSLRAGILSFLLWSNGQPKSRVGNRLISSGWEVLQGHSAKVMDVGRGKWGHICD